MSLKKLPEVTGKAAWIGEMSIGTFTADSLNTANKAWKLKFTDDLDEAEVFIVQDVGQVKTIPALAFRAALIGGVVMTAKAFLAEKTPTGMCHT